MCETSNFGRKGIDKFPSSHHTIPPHLISNELRIKYESQSIRGSEYSGVGSFLSIPHYALLIKRAFYS